MQSPCIPHTWGEWRAGELSEVETEAIQAGFQLCQPDDFPNASVCSLSCLALLPAGMTALQKLQPSRSNAAGPRPHGFLVLEKDAGKEAKQHD